MRETVRCEGAEYEAIGLTVGPFSENSWFLVEPASRAAVAIDPGDEPDRLLDLCRRERLAVRGVLCTHAHIDHVGAVHEVKEAFGVPFWLHRTELPWLEGVARQAGLFGVRVPTVPAVDHYLLEEGETVEIGPFIFRVLFTPGHAAGHCAFAIGDAVFSGDCLFAGSIGRTDLPGGDHQTLLASIWEKLVPLGDATQVFSGHGPATTIGRERVTNPFLTDIP